jgi:hypothetical protein
LGVELKFSFVSIGDNGRVEGSEGVGINSKVSDMLDVWVEALESITEFCIAGEEGDGTIREGCKEGVELGIMICESKVIIWESLLTRVEYSIFFRLKISCELLLLLLLLTGFELSIFWLKRYSSNSEFLFNGLVFLNTFLGFSIPLNFEGLVEKGGCGGGCLNMNAFVLSVTLCLDIPNCFLLINNESAVKGSNSVLLAIKEV